MSTSSNTHLLVLPVPMRRADGKLLFEAQAAHGLQRWCDHFESLIVATPVLPEPPAENVGTMDWVETTTLACTGRVEFVPLPYAYRVLDFARAFRPTRDLLRSLIKRTRYLQFAIGGLVGDWAAVAAAVALRLRRKYAVHMDNVGHEYARIAARKHGWRRRTKARLLAPPMRLWHQHLIRNAALALCNGYDCYEAYRGLSTNAHLIHNTHTRAADRLSDGEIDRKARTVQSRGTLRVCYVGRIAPEKAPLDWARAIAHARSCGAQIEAAWAGDGPLRQELEQEIDRLALNGHVTLLGHIRDRAQIMRTLSDADVLLFTHVVRESPRCLKESLVRGTPIVGYQSGFATELISTHGGGRLSPPHDVQRLGHELANLAHDRGALAELIRNAHLSGSRFTAEAVFQERSSLIKAVL